MKLTTAIITTTTITIFMRGIYDYMLETNHISKPYIVLQLFLAYNLRYVIIIIIIIFFFLLQCSITASYTSMENMATYLVFKKNCNPRRMRVYCNKTGDIRITQQIGALA